MWRLGLICFCLSISACAGAPPVREYNLAAAAMDAAKRQNSPEVSPGYWSRAEAHYRRGKRAYEKEQYALAKEELMQAKIFAERAENATVLKKAQNGGE
jgi:hypothetical protein